MCVYKMLSGMRTHTHRQIRIKCMEEKKKKNRNREKKKTDQMNEIAITSTCWAATHFLRWLRSTETNFAGIFLWMYVSYNQRRLHVVCMFVCLCWHAHIQMHVAVVLLLLARLEWMEHKIDRSVFVCLLVDCIRVADYVNGTKIKLHWHQMCVRKRRRMRLYLCVTLLPFYSPVFVSQSSS